MNVFAAALTHSVALRTKKAGTNGRTPPPNLCSLLSYVSSDSSPSSALPSTSMGVTSTHLNHDCVGLTYGHVPKIQYDMKYANALAVRGEKDKKKLDYIRGAEEGHLLTQVKKLGADLLLCK